MHKIASAALVAAGFGTALCWVPVAAHHSTSEYDETQVVDVEGQIVEVFWRNPHVIVKVASNEGGQSAVWELEGSSVSSQRRRGLTGDMLNVGDTVRVAGFASTRRPNHMILNHLLLPNGVELLLRSARTPRFSDGAVLGNVGGETEIDTAKVQAATARAEGIFRVWSWGRAEPGWWFFSGPERFPLTESALASLADYNEYEDNPVLKCIAPGMAATMGNPYPVQFVQVNDKTIEIRQEEFDRIRTIHLNADPQADVAPSPLGYSVGRWEDENTLVIKTTRINAPYFNRVGVRQSPAVEVDERFTVGDDGSRLDYELVVTDPPTLKEPWAWKAHWVWVPGEEVGPYQCAVAE